MQTLTDLLTALFPFGTDFPAIAGLELQDDDGGASRRSYNRSPVWPPDVFAFAAKLLDISGAYHHVSPETLSPDGGGQVRQLKVTSAERISAVAVGKKWAALLRRRRSPLTIQPAPREVQDAWTALRKAGLEPLFIELNVKADAPSWWRSALFLLMASDEAARDIGFDPDTRRVTDDPESLLEIFTDLFRFVPPSEHGRSGADNPYSCSFANQNVVGVMPKSRTPVVGCTLRSLSHNLALLPPGGEVRVRWLSPHEVDAQPDVRPLKMLVVPYPYQIEAECFEPVDVASVAAPATPWGWFHIAPRWLGTGGRAELLARAGEFADFVVELIEEAGRDGEPVSAVILPEAALNEVFFATLFDAILRRCPKVETLISGTSEKRDEDGKIRTGNFVTQGVFVTSQGKRQGVRTVREKHHRWRIERSQIEIYDLGHRLNPSTIWWEGIEITSRALDIVAFRPHATMTTLICEDLARVDPCQGAVRAVGPSLLVALLMDGSQLSFRWPGRYATVLAEDPGCSVLTVSSLGLINRSRLPDGSRPKWSVALWRDDSSGPTEVVLSPGHHAVVLVADATWRTECSLDGRQDDGQALAWKLRTSGSNAPTSVKASRVPAWIGDGVR